MAFFLQGAALLKSSLTLPDWIAIACYFGVLIAVAWWVISRNRNNAEDYFLAGRNLSWWVIGASIFASNIGSEHIVGLAGSGAKDGVSLAHYELHAWCLLVLAWVFVPFYMRSQVFTMPEFLERRFSVGSRYVLSIVSIITFVVSKIAVGIFAGGVVFATLLPEMRLNIAGVEISSFWVGSILVIVLTGLYTMLGGMRAVAYNDAVQVVVLIGGSAVLTFYGLHKLGGFDNGYPAGSFLWIVNNINFQYFSVVITIVAAVVMVAVSLATVAPDPAKIQGLTYATASEGDREETRRSWHPVDVVSSIVILVAILGAYLYFRG